MEVNKDFYIENGYYVFTEEYHLKRGYCCKSGCRHCPWNYNRPKLTNENDKDSDLKNKDEK